MAILDERAEFCDAVDIAAAAGTANVGDIMDLSVARDIGNGQPVYLVITVDTEIITGGSAGTVQFLLVSDATTSISTTTATIHFQSEVFATDDAAANDSELNAGEVPVAVAIPLEGPEFERYLGIQVVTATTTTTDGDISAYLTLDPPGAAWKSYADATN